MNPAVRILLIIGGALIGARLGATFGALAGAALGLLAAESLMLRARVSRLEGELSSLRRRLPASREAAEPAPPATPFIDPAVNPTPASGAPRTPSPAAPAERPAAPRLLTLQRFFTGGNTLVRIGIIVLFFGIAFLLRYAAEHSHVPLELRLAGIALGAIGLLGLGGWLRPRRAGYAFALQGGGVGILYLTVFAALRLYGLLPPTFAFGLLVLIAALSAVLAILQDSQGFALLGAAGGFLAPLLASSGTGSHGVLFSYYAVLNGGIVAIAWFRAWRPLNLLGFVGTFVIATGWGVLRYQAGDFATSEPFLVAFFLFYVGIAVLFARQRAAQGRGYVDGTLLFGTPFVAFGLQTAMLHRNSLALAFSALGVSAVYLGLAAWLARQRDAAQHVLLDACLALGVVFLTLAIPLALGNRLNAAAWALEGAGLVWIGCRQSRRLARSAGLLLILAAAGLVLAELEIAHGQWRLPAASYAGVVLVSVAGLFGAWSLRRAAPPLEPWERLHAPALFLVGLGCWCAGTLGELPHVATGQALPAAALAFLAVSAALLGELGRRTRLVYASWSALCLLPVMGLIAIIDRLALPHAFVAGGWAAWPLSVACLYRILWQHETAAGDAWRRAEHAFAWLLACALLSEEAAWVARRLAGLQGDWPVAAALLPPALGLLALLRLVHGGRWPFAANRDAYLGLAAPLLAVLLACAVLVSNLLAAGDSTPLPYVPLLNPFDLAELLVGVALYRLLHRLGAGEPPALPRGLLAGLFAVGGFVWCNGVLLRTLHHLLDIPMAFAALFASNVVETALSIFWSVLALLIMLLASRRRHRLSWLVGAALLGLVIAKLFFVDLSSVGSIERIISFVGVGLLMLVIGYFSPLPPRSGETS